MQVVKGLFGACLFPMATVLLAAWIPKNERATLGGLVLGGAQVSTVLLQKYQTILYIIMLHYDDHF